MRFLGDFFRYTVSRYRRKTFYVCHGTHSNDFVYAENVIEYLKGRGIAVETIALAPQGATPELARCLNGRALGVIGANSQLDHAWIGAENFLDAAVRAGVPVIHWLLDHTSSRWPEFTHARVDNSRFLFLSRFSEAYFQRYGLPGSVTGWTVNTGVSRHSRLPRLTREDFIARPYNCLLALNLRRIGGTLADAIARRDSLEPALAKAVDRAIEEAYFDLDGPIETHLLAALAKTDTVLANDRFNFCVQIVEEIVQIKRRQWIFGIARDFPVLIQSDEEARPFIEGGRAAVEINVPMKTTFARMMSARAVLNVSHVNDEIHNRTLNGLNAGCVNIVEDSRIHRNVFKHGTNALFFRYDDDSLRQCLELVCGDPVQIYPMAHAGFGLRDRQPFRFGGFDNIIRLARARQPKGAVSGASAKGAPSR